MAIVSIILSGFRRRRLITTIYLIQLVLAITVGLQVYQVLNASIGHSMSLEGLNLGNTHMVINDLLNVHGASLSPILGQVRWLIVVYLVVAAFIHAGVWYHLIRQSDKVGFWVGGATYFAKSLGVSTIMMILFLIISGLLWGPYLGNIQPWMEAWPSEAPILWIGIFIFIVWSLFAVYFFVASSFSKIFLIRDDFGIWKATKSGLFLSMKRSPRLLPVLLIFLLVLVVIYLSHSLVDDWRLMSSTIGVIVLFFIQQLIVWVKIGLRVSTYSYLLRHSKK